MNTPPPKDQHRPKSRVHPMCRYHERIALERQGDLWSIDGIVPVTVPDKPDQVAVAPSGRGIVLSLYRCPACGYIELFDDADAALE